MSAAEGSRAAGAKGNCQHLAHAARPFHALVKLVLISLRDGHQIDAREHLIFDFLVFALASRQYRSSEERPAVAGALRDSPVPFREACRPSAFRAVGVVEAAPAVSDSRV